MLKQTKTLTEVNKNKEECDGITCTIPQCQRWSSPQECRLKTQFLSTDRVFGFCYVLEDTNLVDVTSSYLSAFFSKEDDLLSQKKTKSILTKIHHLVSVDREKQLFYINKKTDYKKHHMFL